MKHLFTIGEDVWNSVDLIEIWSTAKAMAEAGVFHMPFPEFDIQGTITKPALKQIFSNISEETPINSYTFRYFAAEKFADTRFAMKIGDKFIDIETFIFDVEKHGKTPKQARDSLCQMASYYLLTLVVLLATKNATKTTEKIKKHGPKSRKRPREYDYITTIKIGKITETMRSEGDGSSTVRPHLRRGHIRNQRVGKGLTEVKSIFIHPVFVNADEKWISNQRKEYRLVA